MPGRYASDDDIGRKRPASGVFINLGTPTIVYLTVCIEDRQPWLANEAVHEHLRGAWQDAQAWLVGYYLLMPDHLHLFCAPRDLKFTIEHWVTFWERQFKRRVNRSRGSQGSAPACASHADRKSRPPIEYRWQPHPWHTRLRRSENYQEKWAYIRENPVVAGLVKNANDWPYQGMMIVLPW